MATLTGNTVASTYKQLLKVTSEGIGADASAKYIEDGLGTDSALSISTTRVGIGETAPGAKLQVKVTASSSGHASNCLRVTSETGTSTGNSLLMGVNESSAVYTWIEGKDLGVGALPIALNANGGNVAIGNTVASFPLSVKAPTSSSTAIAHFQNAGTSSPSGLYVQFSGDAPGDRTDYYLYCTDTGSTNDISLFSDGGASFSGDVTVNTGNLIMGTAGKGIDFSNQTSANSVSGVTTGSEVLDHYEEGAWTPILTGATNGACVNFAIQVASYTRIGRLVHVTCHMVMTNINNSGGSAISGNLTIAGLPFTPSNTNDGYCNGVVRYGATALPTSTDNSATIAGTVLASVNKNSTTISLLHYDGAAELSSLQASEFSADGGAIFDITYMV